MFSKIVALVLIGLIILLGLLMVFRLTPLWDRILTSGHFKATDFTNLTTTRNPNWFLVCPPEYCSNVTVHLEAPSFDQNRDELAAKFKKIVKSDENVTIRFENEKTLDVEIRTPFMRWPDLVSIEFIARGDDGSTFAIYSRSIYGSIDFGANKKRVQRWLNALGKR